MSGTQVVLDLTTDEENGIDEDLKKELQEIVNEIPIKVENFLLILNKSFLYDQPSLSNLEKSKVSTLGNCQKSGYISLVKFIAEKINYEKRENLTDHIIGSKVYQYVKDKFNICNSEKKGKGGEYYYKDVELVIFKNVNDFPVEFRKLLQIHDIKFFDDFDCKKLSTKYKEVKELSKKEKPKRKFIDVKTTGVGVQGLISIKSGFCPIDLQFSVQSGKTIHVNHVEIMRIIIFIPCWKFYLNIDNSSCFNICQKNTSSSQRYSILLNPVKRIFNIKYLTSVNFQIGEELYHDEEAYNELVKSIKNKLETAEGHEKDQLELSLNHLKKSKTFYDKGGKSQMSLYHSVFPFNFEIKLPHNGMNFKSFEQMKTDKDVYVLGDYMCINLFKRDNIQTIQNESENQQQEQTPPFFGFSFGSPNKRRKVDD